MIIGWGSTHWSARTLNPPAYYWVDLFPYCQNSFDPLGQGHKCWAWPMVSGTKMLAANALSDMLGPHGLFIGPQNDAFFMPFDPRVISGFGRGLRPVCMIWNYFYGHSRCWSYHLTWLVKLLQVRIGHWALNPCRYSWCLLSGIFRWLHLPNPPRAVDLDLWKSFVIETWLNVWGLCHKRN